MYLSLQFSFPYKKHISVKDYFFKEYSISKNKSLEIQISKWGHSYTLFGITIRPSWYQDHSGFMVDVTLFNISFIANLYDHRHWDYEKGKWDVDGQH
jgi:hypothetical protein